LIYAVRKQNNYVRVTCFGYFASLIGIGSGVIICETGFIVTNNHVVSNATGDFADKINVRLKTGQTFEAVVAWHRPDADLAILKLDACGLPVARFGSISEHCTLVFAVGYSAQTQEMIIAEDLHIGRTDAFALGGNRLIQTTTELVRGNSGGGLFNSYGELVGIVTAKYVGIGADSIGLSVPIDVLRENAYKDGNVRILSLCAFLFDACVSISGLTSYISLL